MNLVEFQLEPNSFTIVDYRNCGGRPYAEEIAMKKLFLIAVVLAIQACASVNVTPPSQKHIERSRTYAMDFDKTWTRAVDWFADHNVSIEKIEKPSGLLTAKYLLETNDTYLDCGQIDVQGVLGKPTIKRLGSLNVTIRSASQTTTAVNVNFFGEFDLRARDLWDGRPLNNEGRCISTGELERKILDFVGR